MTYTVVSIHGLTLGANGAIVYERRSVDYRDKRWYPVKSGELAAQPPAAQE